jgi:hypothetical protein
LSGRNFDGKARASSRRILISELASMLPHDAERAEEAEARAIAFSCEPRFEESIAKMAGNARTLVINHEQVKV